MNKNPLYLPPSKDNDLLKPESGWGEPGDRIPSRSHVKGLMECTGVWHAGGKFGVSWKLVQAQVRPPVRIQGFCIMDDSDDEDVEAVAVHEENTAFTAPSFSSDEDSTPVAAKPKVRRAKKKVVRKKQ